MSKKRFEKRLVSVCAAAALLLTATPALLTATAATVESVALNESMIASGDNGFYFTVTPQDSLPYYSDWSVRAQFTTGGVYLSDGTRLTSARTFTKYGPNNYYVSLADNYHEPIDGEIVYVAGSIETTDVTVTYERTAFQYDADTQMWSIVASFVGAQTTLGDTLDLNMAVCIPKAIRDLSPVMKISFNGTETTHTIPTTDANGYYWFTQAVPAKDMTTPITATLQSADGATVYAEKTYTVGQYAEAIINGEYVDAYKVAARAMLNYGAYVQTYFSHNVGNPANVNCAYTSELSAVDTSLLPKVSVTGKAEGFAGYSLLLKSRTAIRLYFDVPVDGAVAKDGKYFLEIADIGAGDLDTVYTVTANGSIYAVSVLAIARMVLDGAYGSAFKNMIKSMVLYSQAAEELHTGLLITGPVGKVHPYHTAAQAYLEAPAGSNVANYINGSSNPNKDTVISWAGTLTGVTGYTVQLATESDYSDAVTLTAAADATSVSVNNLYKATTYYVKVTAEGVGVTEEYTFTTTDLGPRVMTVDGVYNVRDIGGYATSLGKTTLQGLLYRGGALSPSADTAYDFVQITDKGIRTMSDIMGIKTEVDFRNTTESLGITESFIPGAELVYYTLGGYDTGIQNYGEGYRKMFAKLARPESYPVYFHCTGGADRTGTVAFLVNALLGVEETTLIQDYEFTSFSVYGERNSQGTVYPFAEFLTALKAYEGETLMDKTENYLLSIGVTADEIYNIRAIMFGEETRELPDLPTEEEPDSGETDNKATSFFSYMNSTDTITLNSTATTVTSDKAVGYGTTVHIPMKTTTVGSNGSLYVYIGSYGIRLRGAEFRVHTRTTGGAEAEIARFAGMDCPINVWDNGGTLDFMVTPAGDTVTLYVKATSAGGTSYVFTKSYSRIVDEIASEDAKVYIKIDTGEVSELVIQGEEVEGIPTFFDYMNSNDAVTLDSTTKSVTSDKAVGYGSTVRIPMKTTYASASVAGSLYVYIGSYGVRLRAGQFRFASGSDTEMQPRPTNTLCETNIWDNGGYLDLCVTLSGNDVIFDLTATDEGDRIYTYQQVYSGARISGEIASADAKITVKIDPSMVTELIISE